MALMITDLQTPEVIAWHIERIREWDNNDGDKFAPTRQFCKYCNRETQHVGGIIPDNKSCRDTRLHTPRPEVGMPATILLYTDTQAAVVTKVNAKSVVVARVAGKPDTKTVRHADGNPFPITDEEGDLTQIIGEPERYAFNGRGFANGTIAVMLGRSINHTDYRY